MFQLSDDFLKSSGLTSLPEGQKHTFLHHISCELEKRVGASLSKEMSDEKLREIEKIDATNLEDALSWMEINCPNYRQIVAEEVTKIQQELIRNRDKILSVEGIY